MIVVDPVPQDARALRNAYGCFPSGIIALSGMVDCEPVGMIAGSFTTVSLDPPLVSVCIQNSSTTWPKLRQLGRLGISILSAEQEAPCRQIATRNGSRFAGIDWEQSERGAVFLKDAVGLLECQRLREIEAGDHVIALLEIVAVSVRPNINPLVFHASQFRQLHL